MPETTEIDMTPAECFAELRKLYPDAMLSIAHPRMWVNYPDGTGAERSQWIIHIGRAITSECETLRGALEKLNRLRTMSGN